MSKLVEALNGIVSNVDALATKVVENKAELANKVSYVGDDKGRTKSILLNNNEMILGSSVDTPPSGGFIVEGGADNHNLIMVNKWNVVDVGSPKVPLTLNAYSGVVKINDEKIVATVDQIPVDANGKLKADALPEEAVTVADIQVTLEDYAEKTYVDEKVSALGAVMKIVGKVDSVDALPETAEVGSVYLVTEGDETAEYVFAENTGWEKLGTTTKVDLSGYATETFVSNAIADKADKSEVATSLTEAKEYADEKDVTTLDEAKAFANNKFVEKEIVGTLGVAKVWNEVTGGGAMFTRTDGVKSFVGVNQGNGETSRDVNAQIYAIDSNSVGTRLNIYKDGITYAKNLGKGQQDIESHPELEIAVKGDITSGVVEAKAYTDSSIEAVNTSLTDILAQIAELKAKIENV